MLAETDDLQTCPFCGAKGQLKFVELKPYGKQYKVECSKRLSFASDKCPVNGRTRYGHKHEVIRIWNTRVSDSF